MFEINDSIISVNKYCQRLSICVWGYCSSIREQIYGYASPNTSGIGPNNKRISIHRPISEAFIMQ